MDQQQLLSTVASCIQRSNLNLSPGPNLYCLQGAILLKPKDRLMCHLKRTPTSVTDERKFNSMSNFKVVLFYLMEAIAIGGLGAIDFCIFSSVHY